jgi:hypothetical protein
MARRASAARRARKTSRRGGLRSHGGRRGRTYKQLYAEAKDRGIDGRSHMNKAQLERALAR